MRPPGHDLPVRAESQIRAYLDIDDIIRIARPARMAAAGRYPLMLKASWGGGGRGMRVVEGEADLGPAMKVARREAIAASGNDPKHLAAPMPGSAVSVVVRSGQRLAKGALLLSIKAMKMETALIADGDVVVKAGHVRTGDVIAVKDLLVEFA